MHRFLRGLFVCGLLSGCATLAPAPELPQLRHTPGPAIVTDHEQFMSATLRLNYPDGWRIVRANTTAEPLRVFFVSPDNQQIIRVALAEPTDGLVLDGVENIVEYEVRERIAGEVVYISGVAPEAQEFDFLRALQTVQQSLQGVSIR